MSSKGEIKRGPLGRALSLSRARGKVLPSQGEGKGVLRLRAERDREKSILEV